MPAGRWHIKRCMKHLHKNKIVYAYAAAAGLLLLSALLGIVLGSSNIPLRDVAGVLFGGHTDSPEANIIRFIRLPRVLASLVCGAALAVSGAVIQGVLANRLASPGIIGINAGAGLAVTLCAALGVYGGWRVSLAAFVGAFATALLVSLGAKKWGASRGTVILAGVAINSLLGAVSDTVVTFFPDASIISNDFRVGDFAGVTHAKLLPAAILIGLAMLVLFTLSNELDVLTLGDENARGLGLNTSTTRLILLLLAALLCGAAVSVAGLLSFVGLLVPHAVRRAADGRAKHLLPLCALFGGGFVTLCDTLARTVFAPYELPVGILMAFLGAPFFLFILIKGKGGHRHA